MNYYKFLMEKPPISVHKYIVPIGHSSWWKLPLSSGQARKTKQNPQVEITHSHFYFKHLPTFLFTFASILSKFFFAHWGAFSLPLNTYSRWISKSYPAPRLILFPVTNIFIVWFGKERNFLNVEEYKNGTRPTRRGPKWLECITATAFSSCMLSLLVCNVGCHLPLIASKCPYTHGNRQHTSRVSEQRSCCQSTWEFQHQKGFPFWLVDH